MMFALFPSKPIVSTRSQLPHTQRRESTVDSVARRAIQQPRLEPAVPLKDRMIVPQFSFLKLFCLFVFGIIPAIIYAYTYYNFKQNIEETAQQMAKDVHDAVWEHDEPHSTPDVLINLLTAKLAEVHEKIINTSSGWKFALLGMNDEAIRVNLALALIGQEGNFLEPGNQNAFRMMKQGLTSASNQNPEIPKKAMYLIDLLLFLKDPSHSEETENVLQHQPPVQPVPPPPALRIEAPLPLPTPAESFKEQLRKSNCPRAADFLSSLLSKSKVEAASYDPKTGEFTISFDQPYTVYLANLTNGIKGIYKDPNPSCNQLRFEKVVRGKIQKSGDKETITFTPESGSIPLGFGRTASLPPISYTTVNGQTTASLKLPIIGEKLIPLENFKGILRASYMQPQNIAFNANNLSPQYRLG